MSGHEDEVRDDTEPPRELSEDELDDVAGGSCVEMNPAHLSP